MTDLINQLNNFVQSVKTYIQPVVELLQSFANSLNVPTWIVIAIPTSIAFLFGYKVYSMIRG